GAHAARPHAPGGDRRGRVPPRVHRPADAGDAAPAADPAARLCTGARIERRQPATRGRADRVLRGHAAGVPDAPAHAGKRVSTTGLERAARDPLRRDAQLRGAGPRDRRAGRGTGRGPRERRQPHRHRDPLPPRGGGRWRPDRVRRRTLAQAVVAAPRACRTRSSALWEEIMTQNERGARFRQLHENGPLVLPNAWDAASARVIELAGAPAIATTSAGVSWAHGRRDGQELRRDEMIEAIRRIVEAVDVPVTADIEGGYGSG